MSNNNMREIGHVFINHAGEFQFTNDALSNSEFALNVFPVHMTENDFQNACKRAKELFAAMKGE